jgi:hypothetical protein
LSRNSHSSLARGRGSQHFRIHAQRLNYGRESCHLLHALRAEGQSTVDGKACPHPIRTIAGEEQHAFGDTARLAAALKWLGILRRFCDSRRLLRASTAPHI